MKLFMEEPGQRKTKGKWNPYLNYAKPFSQYVVATCVFAHSPSLSLSPTPPPSFKNPLTSSH